jgi:multidrug transporter EmrE-like cation transporter
MLSKIIIGLYVITTSFALIMLKLGSTDGSLVSVEGSRLHLNLTAMSIVGGLLYGTSFLIYTFLVAKYDLGFIIPLVTGLVYVFIFVLSFFIFKESFSFIKVLSIALIFTGVTLLSLYSNSH